jgi:AcrR family transcriptional regulator
MAKSRLHRKTQTEIKLFEAALVVFGNKGRFGANTQEIADTAGITKASLHYYFRHKDDLYKAAFGFVLGEIAAQLRDSVTPGLSMRETLNAFCANVIDFYLERPWVVKLWCQENLNGGEMVKDHLGKLVDGNSAPLSAFIGNVEAAIAKGEIQKTDPYQVFFTAIGSCFFPFIVKPTLGRVVPRMADNFEGFMEERKKAIAEIIFSGLARRSEDAKG